MGAVGTERDENCACTLPVAIALASAKSMKWPLKAVAVMKKLKIRMLIPRIDTRTL